jgi:hypothetical protein
MHVYIGMQQGAPSCLYNAVSPAQEACHLRVLLHFTATDYTIREHVMDTMSTMQDMLLLSATQHYIYPLQYNTHVCSQLLAGRRQQISTVVTRC